jgi:hypothetical protein
MANGRRSTQRLRQQIDDDAQDYRREINEDRCGTAITNLSGFDRRLLERHDLQPVTAQAARCGTPAEEPSASTDTNAPILALIESHAIH